MVCILKNKINGTNFLIQKDNQIHKIGLKKT